MDTLPVEIIAPVMTVVEPVFSTPVVAVPTAIAMVAQAELLD